MGHSTGCTESFFNKSIALKKKKSVLETILDYKRLLKNKIKYNVWTLLNHGLNTLAIKRYFGNNWRNFNIDQVLEYIKKLLIRQF